MRISNVATLWIVSIEQGKQRLSTWDYVMNAKLFSLILDHLADYWHKMDTHDRSFLWLLKRVVTSVLFLQFSHWF